jgi:hypothetical protein
MSEPTPPDNEALDARLARVEMVLGLQRMDPRDQAADLAGASHQSRSCAGASGLSLGCHCLADEVVAPE